MAQFTLFWLGGTSEVIDGGENIQTAFSKKYGAGAVRALDFYERGDSQNKWKWNSENKKWESKI